MNKLRVLVSLTNNDNDYQVEQAASAELAARRLDLDLTITYAENDAVTQSQQILSAIQSAKHIRPEGIVFEPAGGTAMPQVARAAAAAQIGCAILNREADYAAELRRTFQVPVCAVTSDHEEIGRMQGRQLAALLPRGGNVLYIQGPSESAAAKQRTSGMYETKPVEVTIKLMKAHWTEASSYRTVSSWLKLSTSRQSEIDLVAAQDDSMALGARRAFQDLPNGLDRERWLKLPFLGCDGLPKTGQAWVNRGLLAATIYIPPNAGQAIELLVNSLRNGVMPPERTVTALSSFPPLEKLKRPPKAKTEGASA